MLRKEQIKQEEESGKGKEEDDWGRFCKESVMDCLVGWKKACIKIYRLELPPGDVTIA
jgi:hypothetical protein